MSSAMADWGVGQFLQICLGIVSAPTQFWCALLSDDPGTDMDGTDLQGLEPDPALGYARVSIPTGTGGWSVSDGTPYSQNLADIDFGLPTGQWGAITHFALTNDPTAGEIYLYGEFDVPANVDGSTSFIIPSGGVVMAFGSFAPSIVAV